MKHSLLFSCVALLILITGCRYKDLDYQYALVAHVRVTFDWSDSPSAAPQGMRVLFYPVNGGEPYEENLSGMNGGLTDVPTGRYNIVAFNNDTETIRWRGAELQDSLEAYTRGTSILDDFKSAEAPKAEGTENEPIVLAPDKMWRAYLADVAIVQGDEEQIVPMKPEPATVHLSFDLSTVTNSKGISNIRAAISGLSGSRFFGSNLLSVKPSIVPFDGKISDTDATKIIGEVDIFGKCPDTSVKQLFTIYCWSPGGNVKATFDVTDQIKNAPDPTNIHLVLVGTIDIPEGVGNGGGFHPDVGEWTDHNEGLDL